MNRRHLFDNGFPVCTQTLLAGAEVLLAVSRQSLRRSHGKMASSLVGLADSAKRLLDSLGRLGASEIELDAWRQRYSTVLSHEARNRIAASGEAGAGVRPGRRPACEKPHQR
jgi:hypothetical protein